jgi:hypothetical protein
MTDTIDNIRHGLRGKSLSKFIKMIRNHKQSKVISSSYVDAERPSPEIISEATGLDNTQAIEATQKGLNNMLKEFQEKKVKE